MDGLERFDHTHAIFAGFNAIWQRMLLFCACGVFGQFVGGNIYTAPDFISNVLTNGPSALADLRPLDLAWMPMEWAGALLASTFHPVTLFYVLLVMVAFLSLMRDDEIRPWTLAVLLIGQPIDAWLLRGFFAGKPIVSAQGISLALLLIYTALTSGGFYLWWRLREDPWE